MAGSTKPQATSALPEGWVGAGAATRTCECSMLGTGCTATTTRRFAPGHDAKAKSLLLRLHRTGQKAKVTVDGKTFEVSPREAASRWGFAHMIVDAKAPVTAADTK